METENNVTKSIGLINSSDGFFSNRLKAFVETVFSSRPTKIFLTVEDDVNFK